MHEELPAWIRYRWKRPDGARDLHPDAERYLKPAPFDHKAFIAEFRAAKQKEAEAARLAAEQEREERQRRTDILRLKSDIAWLRFQCALVLHMIALQRKASFNPIQPRVPGGNPDGGQWTTDGGTLGDTGDSRVISDASDTPVLGAQFAELKRPGIGHNNPPPDVPERRPPNVQERNKIAREVARRSGWIGLLLATRQWLRNLGPSIDSYNDPPRTLDELQARVSVLPMPGYQGHHIAEQTSGRNDANFSEEWIEGRNNQVAVPTYKHWDISAWYSRKSDDPRCGGRSPRDYLRDKGWSERYEIGLEALRRHGVLEQ